mmetsp:Transcript_147382/g.274676  ORF Transcript_147382/g.274676 Transcript_147382/m.274676 type:complete len:920 (+) Transcript_147382:128-2887(+)
MLRESNQAEAPGRDHGEGWSLAVSCILQASAFVLLSAPWWAKICWRSVRTIRLPRCDSGEINHMTVKMYISFLTMCQNLFWALTVVSFLFVTPCWGTRPFNIFKREDPGNVHSGFLVTLTDDADHQMAIICMMTAATSLLSFLFVMRFQHASEMCRAPQAQGCTRALWLKDLPIQDHATCQKHELTLSEFSSIVESDLREAIESHLDKKPDHQDSHNASFARRFLGSCGCCGCYLSCDFLCLCCHYESLWRRQQNDPHPLLGSRNSRRPVRRSSSHFHSWSNPTDSVQASSPRSSHVKEITVLPVMSEYCSYVNKYKKVKEAEERTRAWQKRAEAWQKNVDAHMSQAESTKWKRFSPSSWWAYLSYQSYVCLHGHWERTAEKLRSRFLEHARKTEVENTLLEMSGHAFVVFNKERNVRDMLQKTPHRCDLRDSTFRFGRPPFSSVTLKCQRAPPPADLIWEYMHVPFCPNYLFHAVNVLVLVASTAVAVALVICLWDQSLLAELWKTPPRGGVAYLDTSWEGPLLQQTATIGLLGFNSLVVPLWVDCISYCRRYFRHKYVELLQLTLNLGILIFGNCMCPVLALFTIRWLFSPSAGLFRFGHLVGKSGAFSLQYALNCTFISNLVTLMQLGRQICRKIKLCFCVVTEREMKDANAPLQVPWGYWYAWSLNIAFSALIFSVLVPSILPVTALGFTLKLAVERRLLADGVVDPGPAQTGSYVYVNIMVVCFTVIIYIRLLLTFILLIASPSLGISSNEVSIWLGSVVILLAIIVIIIFQEFLLFARAQDPMLLSFRDTIDTGLRTGKSALSRLWAKLESLQLVAPPDMEDAGAALLGAPEVENPQDGQQFDVEDEMTWDARINLLKELKLENETDVQLRDGLRKLLGIETASDEEGFPAQDTSRLNTSFMHAMTEHPRPAG